MVSFRQSLKNQSATSVAVLSLVILTWSFYPLIFKLANGEEKPLIFFIVFRVVCIICGLAWLMINHRQWLKKSVWRLSLTSFISVKGLLVLASWNSMALLMMAAGFVEIAVVSIIAELSGIFFLIFMSRKSRGRDSDYKPISLVKYLLFFVALSGVALVVISQFGWQSFGGHNPSEYILGLALALLGAITGGLGAYTFKMAKQLRIQAGQKQLLTDIAPSDGKVEQQQYFFIMLVTMIGDIMSLLVATVGYFVFRGNLLVSIGQIPASDLWWMIGAGFFICWLSRIGWQWSILRTTNLDINMLCYAGPILAILWLSVFGLADVKILSLLWAGSGLVVAANALIGWLDLKRTPADKPHRHHLFHHHQR